MMSKKIAHLTSVHSRHDIRIFRKQCRTLAAAGYSVNLVVADGKGDEKIDGVDILDAGAPQSGRLRRMTASTRAIRDRALALDADLYHLHDPELLPVALRLKKAGKRVIFDSHEDFAGDILTKPYLGSIARVVISRSYAVYERYVCRKLDFVVAATPSIRGIFDRMGCRAIDINNFPLLEELDEYIAWEEDRSGVCYVGTMTSIRGVPELIDAMPDTDAGIVLHVAGTFTEPAAEERCRNSGGWSRVKDYGFVGRKEVRGVMEKSFAGVVTFLPAPNHTESQPNKMFEYMAAGIPVICSHFPLWREIIERNECGICVDPAGSKAIAGIINQLYRDQSTARAMGARGREAVLSRYNWEGEGKKLVSLYKSILG